MSHAKVIRLDRRRPGAVEATADLDEAVRAVALALIDLQRPHPDPVSLQDAVRHLAYVDQVLVDKIHE